MVLIGKKALCVKTENINAKYSKENIKYPVVGKEYTIASYTTYKSTKREYLAIRFREIKQRQVLILNREIHFPITWFVLEDDPRYKPVKEYYKNFH